jgi:hypothetical protein
LFDRVFGQPSLRQLSEPQNEAVHWDLSELSLAGAGASTRAPGRLDKLAYRQEPPFGRRKRRKWVRGFMGRANCLDSSRQNVESTGWIVGSKSVQNDGCMRRLSVRPAGVHHSPYGARNNALSWPINYKRTRSKRSQM